GERITPVDTGDSQLGIPANVTIYPDGETAPITVFVMQAARQFIDFGRLVIVGTNTNGRGKQCGKRQQPDQQYDQYTFARRDHRPPSLLSRLCDRYRQV